MSEYPVHDKVAEIDEDERQGIGAFLDWLQGESPYRVCELIGESPFETFYPTRRTIEEMMFEFYGLDIEAFRAEKEAMYQQLVAAARKGKA